MFAVITPVDVTMYAIHGKGQYLILYRSYKNCDSENVIYDLLHITWSDIEKCTDVNASLDAWMTLFVGVCAKHG